MLDLFVMIANFSSKQMPIDKILNIFVNLDKLNSELL